MANESSLSKEQRREHKRLNVNLTVLCKVDRPGAVKMILGKRQVNAIMLDMSEGGLSVLADQDIPSGSELSIQFTLFKVEPDDVSFYGPVEIRAQVRYSVPVNQRQFRIGIRFIRMKAKDRGEIREFIDSKVTG